MKIVFFGTPEFVIPIAQSLFDLKDDQLFAVVTNPDRPVGRHAYRQAGKQIPTPSPIKSWAQQNNLKVIDSTLMIHIIRVIKKMKPDLGILAAYGKIIPQEVIDLFPKGILVIHPSLLPVYRGASPIQAAIFNGDQETGVSIIQMDEKMDHGPILAQFKEKIMPNDTAQTLTKRLFAKTAEILPFVLCHPEQSEGSRWDSSLPLRMTIFSPPQPQNHSLATFTKLLTKDDGKIDWHWEPQKIERFVRAMTPWPGAWTNVILNELKNLNRDSSASDLKMTVKRLKILRAHPDKPNTKYQILNTKLVLDEVQLEGKKPVSWKEFQKAYPNFSFLKTCPGRE